MQAHGLVDTGAILALLDADDAWHERCVAAFASLRLPLATTAAVLAELFHLLGDNPHEVSAAWTLLRSGAVTLEPITDVDMPELEQMMERYSDHPMDFADATLVHVANRLSLATILTIDHGDFQTYRRRGNQRFRIVPQPKQALRHLTASTPAATPRGPGRPPGPPGGCRG
jgi:predicted nucleic acid-binding protein